MNNTNPETTTTLLEKLRNKLGTMIEKIIVHCGGSHVDEIVATAIAEAILPKAVPVYRRDPEDSELADANVLVLDVGGVHDPDFRNFDHHQLDRSAAPACAFSLLATFLGMDEALSSFYPWYNAWKTIDSKGPFAWAKAAGVNWEAAKPLISPVSDATHRMWEKASGDKPVNPELVETLAEIGRDILLGADEFTAFCIKADSENLLQEFNGVKVLITDAWFTAKESQWFADAYMKARGIQGGVIVSKDDRGPGRSFFRRQDDPRVDFSKCAGESYTSFAHQGGFILKTKALDQGMVCEVMDKAVLTA